MVDDWALGRAWVARQSNSQVPLVMEGNNRIWCHIFLQFHVCFSSFNRKQNKIQRQGSRSASVWTHACCIITSSTIHIFCYGFGSNIEKNKFFNITILKHEKNCQWKVTASPVFHIIPHFIDYTRINRIFFASNLQFVFSPELHVFENPSNMGKNCSYYSAHKVPKRDPQMIKIPMLCRQIILYAQIITLRNTR